METTKVILLLLGALAFISLVGAQDMTNDEMPETDAARFQCYNFTCISNTPDCLTRSLDQDQIEVGTCCGGGGYCKMTRMELNGYFTFQAECVEEMCTFDELDCPIYGKVHSDCCNTQYCNVESLLPPPQSSSSHVLPSAAPAALALVIAGYFGLTSKI